MSALTRPLAVLVAAVLMTAGLGSTTPPAHAAMPKVAFHHTDTELWRVVDGMWDGSGVWSFKAQKKDLQHAGYVAGITCGFSTLAWMPLKKRLVKVMDPKALTLLETVMSPKKYRALSRTQKYLLFTRITAFDMKTLNSVVNKLGDKNCSEFSQLVLLSGTLLANATMYDSTLVDYHVIRNEKAGLVTRLFGAKNCLVEFSVGNYHGTHRTKYRFHQMDECAAWLVKPGTHYPAKFMVE